MPRDLLVLDEPTNGLDPQGTREVRALIGSLGAEGTTVLVSSHLLSEVAQVCSHLGVMREGKLVAQGPITELQGAATQAVVRTDDGEQAAYVLRELGATSVSVDAVHAEVRGELGAIAPEKAVAALVHSGVAVRGFTSGAPDLEDWFVGLTGEGFDVNG